MPPLQKSGMYYPNKFGLITIKSLEEVMGKNGLNAILNLAGLNHYIENYPPDNLDKGFDFAELSAIGSSLEEMYGPRGGRGLALRAGRATFSDALRNFGALAGAADLDSFTRNSFPPETHLRDSCNRPVEIKPTGLSTPVRPQQHGHLWIVHTHSVSFSSTVVC